eukprot:10113000-Alexandrium_andersonii.AAC.1
MPKTPGPPRPGPGASADAAIVGTRPSLDPLSGEAAPRGSGAGPACRAERTLQQCKVAPAHG